MSALQALASRRSSQMTVTIVYILIAVLGGAAGQILLKKGMGSMGPLTLTTDDLFSILWRVATNPYVIVGLAIYAGSTLFWLVTLSRVDLSYAYPFASFSYVVMLAASWFLFNEDITSLRLMGSFVIMFGVFLISRS